MAYSLKYTLNSDGTSYSVTGYTDITASDTVEIPPKYNNKPVTSIGGEAFYYCTSLTSMTISKSVTLVGNFAFSDCGTIEINYDGTTAEWKDLVSINRGVFKNTRYTCNCIDGVVKKSR